MGILRWMGVGMGVLVLVAGCAGVDEESETRPMGQPVLSATELQEARTEVNFDRHVKPILERRCLACHSGKDLSAGFSLENRKRAMQAGPRGPRIVPGDPDRSLLITVVSSGNHGLSMPAVGMQVPEEDVEVLRLWIQQGAKWPDGPAGNLRAAE